MKVSQSQRQCCAPSAWKVAVLAALGLPAAAQAANLEWNVADGDWNVPTNWNPNQVPGPSDFTFVGRAGGGTAHVTSDVPDTSGVFVYNDNTISVEAGADLDVTNTSDSALDGLRIGDGFGFTGAEGKGQATVTGGELSTRGTSNGNYIRVGVDGGNGTLTQSGGLVYSQRDLIVGQDNSVSSSAGGRSGSVGVYNLSGGTAQVVGGWSNIGQNGGTGTFNLSGTGNFIVGNNDVASNPATGRRDDKNLNVGLDGGTGVFNQEGGTVHVSSWTFVGRQGTSNGTYNQSGGTHATAGWTRVGENATGTYNLSGDAMLNVGNVAGGIGDNDFGDDMLWVGVESNGNGLMTVQDAASVNVSNALLLGDGGAVGTVTQSGGTVNVGGWTSIGTGGPSAGDVGTGTYNLSGGSLNVAGDLNVGDVPNSAGTLNLSGTGVANGGTVFVGKGNASSGVVTQSGGTLNIGAGDMIIASDAGSTGTYNLQGGLLDASGSALSFGAGTADFNITGGRLQDALSINFSLEQDGGTLAPGAGAGTTTIIGDYTEGAAGTLEIELLGLTPGAEFDQLIVNGAVSLLGNLDLIAGPGLAAGNEFLILLNDSNDAIAGNFIGKLDNSSFVDDGYTFTINYQGGDGNDVVVTVVPEPTSLGLLAVGAVGLLVRRRRHWAA